MICITLHDGERRVYGIGNGDIRYMIDRVQHCVDLSYRANFHGYSIVSVAERSSYVACPGITIEERTMSQHGNIKVEDQVQLGVMWKSDSFESP